MSFVRLPVRLPVLLRTFLVAGLMLVGARCGSAGEPQSPDYKIEVTKAISGYNGKSCWVHARAGVIPGGTAGNPGETPIVVLTMQKLDITGSDVFSGLHELRTDDLGKTWVGPTEHDTLKRTRPKPGVEIAPCDFWPKWHKQSGKLLGTGATFWYDTKTNAVMHPAPSETSYSVYDPSEKSWLLWKNMEMPNESQYYFCRAGCTQRYDLPDGDILLPIYYNKLKDPLHTSTIARCRFDGTTLKFIEQGTAMSHPSGRGFAEPSLTKFGDWFYVTLRNDAFAAVARSRDGLHFEPTKPWTYDDGQPLGSYNTQAHWVTHSDGLFLTYTRKGAKNDHVFRHRAPLFIAQVDPERMVVLRNTERIAIAERGAGLGNFGITDVSQHETWIIDTEWMQSWPPNLVMPVDNKFGADNSVYVAKIKWSKPNKLVAE